MVIELIGLAAAVLGGLAYYSKRTGFDRVLIKGKERPEQLVGRDVLVFIPSLRSKPGGVSPLGRVLNFDAGFYVVEFRSPWTTEYGNLSSIRVRSAMDGNPVSRVGSTSAWTIPIIVTFPDGREARWELGTNFDEVVAPDKSSERKHEE